MDFKKILQFALGPIGSAVIGLITIPIMTWYISSENIGRLSLIQTLTSLSILIFSFGLDQVFVREFHEKDDKSALFKSVFYPGLAFVLVFFALLAPFQEHFVSYLVGKDSWLIYSSLFILFLSAYVNRFLTLILRMQERGLAFSLSQLMPKLIFLSLFITFFVSSGNNNFTTLLFIHVVSIFFITLLLLWNLKSNIISIFKARFCLQDVREYMKFGLPLVFSGIAFWGLTGMDKVIISQLSSLDELGLYAISVNFAAVGLILQSVFSTIWAPILYKWVSKGDNLDKVKDVTELILFVIVLIFSMSGLFSWLIGYFLPSSYDEVQYLFILCLAFPLFYTLSETTVVGIGVTRKTVFAMMIAITAALFNLCGNYILVPRYGALGASISTAVSFWLFFLLRTETSFRLWMQMPRFKIYFFTLICLITSISEGLFGRDFGFELKLIWLVIFMTNLLFSWKLIKKYFKQWKYSSN